MRPFIALIALTVPLAAQPGPVVISELMWSGSSASSADEWIELYNRSDSTIDLSGWTITRQDGDDDSVMLVLKNATIASGQTFLIANYSADHEKSQLAIQPQYVDPAISLPNTKLLVRLYDGDPQTGATLIDLADDGRGVPFAGDAVLKHAMVRTAFDQRGDLRESWTTASEQSGWDTAADARGTPGSIPTYLLSEQSSRSTLIESTTWAVLKANLPH